MAWIRFTANYDFKATPAVTIAYKPGDYNVPAACATLAIAAGKAVRLRKTNKDEVPAEWQSAQEPANSTGE